MALQLQLVTVCLKWREAIYVISERLLAQRTAHAPLYGRQSAPCALKERIAEMRRSKSCVARSYNERSSAYRLATAAAPRPSLARALARRAPLDGACA